MLAEIGDWIQLNGEESVDPDEHSLSYLWSIIEKPEGSSADLEAPTVSRPGFSLDAVGEYVVVLIVNDGKQDSHSDKVTITCTKPSEVAEVRSNQKQ